MRRTRRSRKRIDSRWLRDSATAYRRLKACKTRGVLRCVISIARINGKQSENNNALRCVFGDRGLYQYSR